MSSALLLILAFSFSLANPAQNRANNRSFFFDDLKIGTWNTLGHAWFLDQYLDLQIAHIPRDLDVLHLTEVWTDEAKDRFLASKRVKETFPHSYFSKVQVGTPLGCAYAQDGLLEQYVGEFIGCLLAFGVNTQTVIETVPGMPDLCTQAQGQVGLYGIDPATGSYPGMECISCVIGAMMNLPNDQGAYGAITQCATPTNPQFTYGGQPGQLILSKHKIEDVKEVPFANGFIVATSNIYATINGFRVGFSHFAYNLFEGNSLLPPGFGAYFPYTTQPQQAQNFIAEKPDVCLGDLNSGDGPDGSFINLKPRICLETLRLVVWWMYFMTLPLQILLASPVAQHPMRTSLFVLRMHFHHFAPITFTSEKAVSFKCYPKHSGPIRRSCQIMLLSRLIYVNGGSLQNSRRSFANDR